jgi:hypothetical protein
VRTVKRRPSFRPARGIALLTVGFDDRRATRARPRCSAVRACDDGLHGQRAGTNARARAGGVTGIFTDVREKRSGAWRLGGKGEQARSLVRQAGEPLLSKRSCRRAASVLRLARRRPANIPPIRALTSLCDRPRASTRVSDVVRPARR